MHSFYRLVRLSELLDKIFVHVVEMTKENVYRNASQSFAIIDSQSVKTTSASDERGFEGGKKIKGQKRHIAVDAMGNLLDVVVHAANPHDTKTGYFPALAAMTLYPTIRGFNADAGYRGTFVD